MTCYPPFLKFSISDDTKEAQTGVIDVEDIDFRSMSMLVEYISSGSIRSLKKEEWEQNLNLLAAGSFSTNLLPFF